MFKLIRIRNKNESDKYTEKTYRNEQYFASFPDEQKLSIRNLLNHLCERFSIPKSLPPLARQFDHDLAFFDQYTGIASHANFRSDKWDIGPAFDWTDLGITNSQTT